METLSFAASGEVGEDTTPAPIVDSGAGFDALQGAIDQAFDECQIQRLQLRPDRALGYDGQTDEVTLAMTIYGEARGESRTGKLLVGQVVLNRVNDPHKRKWFGFKDGEATIQSVCTAPSQFSCFNKNDPNRYKLLDPHTYDYLECIKAARIVLDGAFPDLTKESTHYFNPNVADPFASGAWKREKMLKTVSCGNHDFYREEA